MFNFLGFGSTVILYGALSGEAAGSINPIAFLGKKATLESFFLPLYMAELEPSKAKEFQVTSELLSGDMFKTEVNKRYGFHQIHEAI